MERVSKLLEGKADPQLEPMNLLKKSHQAMRTARANDTILYLTLLVLFDLLVAKKQKKI